MIDLLVNNAKAYTLTTLVEEELSEEARIIEEAKVYPARFKVLYNRYFKVIFLFVHNRVADKDTSADITSQVFFNALRKLKSFQYRRVPFSAWLYRIARNEVNMFFRKQKRMRTVVIDDRVMDNLGREEGDDLENLQEKKQKLAVVMKDLKTKEVELLQLRFFESMSFKEIGVVLGITENNAKVKVHRLLKKIREKLGIH